MRIEERAVGPVRVLSVIGDITSAGGAGHILKDTIASLIAGGQNQVVLDLGQASYIDSVGLGEVFRAVIDVQRSGGAMVFCALTKRIKDLLVITKLVGTVELFDSLDDALGRFATGIVREIACPVCAPTFWQIETESGGVSACSSCGVQFSYPATAMSGSTHASQSRVDWKVPIAGLRWRPYADSDSDEVKLMAGEPAVVTITGRLDLFTLDVVETAWRVTTPPCCVLFDATRVTAWSRAGWDALEALCTTREGSQRALILPPKDAPLAGAGRTLNYDGAIAELRSRRRGPLRIETVGRLRTA